MPSSDWPLLSYDLGRYSRPVLGAVSRAQPAKGGPPYRSRTSPAAAWERECVCESIRWFLLQRLCVASLKPYIVQDELGRYTNPRLPYLSPIENYPRTPYPRRLPIHTSDEHYPPPFQTTTIDNSGEWHGARPKARGGSHCGVSLDPLDVLLLGLGRAAQPDLLGVISRVRDQLPRRVHDSHGPEPGVAPADAGEVVAAHALGLLGVGVQLGLDERARDGLPAVVAVDGEGPAAVCRLPPAADLHVAEGPLPDHLAVHDVELGRRGGAAGRSQQ